MEKKIIAAVMAVMLTLGTGMFTVRESSFIDSMAITASAETYNDFEYEEDLNLGTLRITKYSGSDSEVVIPSEINGKTVSHIAMSSCKVLKKVSIPETVENIEYGAFTECPNLEEISVDENNEHYVSDDGVLYNKEKTILVRCPAKKSGIAIPDSVKLIDSGAFDGCNKFASLDIPDNVQTINDYAFSNCSNLKSISISKGVTSISLFSFINCVNFEEINVDSNNRDYSSEDGVLYNKEKDTLIYCPMGRSGITIPDSVKNIGSYAVYTCMNLHSITVPESVTDISEYSLGYYDDGGGSDAQPQMPDFKIRCCKGSAAEIYAKGCNFKYELIESYSDKFSSSRNTNSSESNSDVSSKADSEAVKGSKIGIGTLAVVFLCAAAVSLLGEAVIIIKKKKK